MLTPLAVHAPAAHAAAAIHVRFLPIYCPIRAGGNIMARSADTAHPCRADFPASAAIGIGAKGGFAAVSALAAVAIREPAGAGTGALAANA